VEEAEADQAKEKAQKEHAAAQKQQKEASSAEESEKASEKMKKADLDMENAANKKKQANAQAGMAEKAKTPTKREYSNLETRMNDTAEAEKEGVNDKAAFVKGYHAGRIDGVKESPAAADKEKKPAESASKTLGASAEPASALVKVAQKLHKLGTSTPAKLLNAAIQDVKPPQPFMPKEEALLGEPEEALQGDFTDLDRNALFGANYIARVASPPRFSISGPEKVSRKCNITRKAECDDRAGCMWLSVKELRKGVSNGCVDAAKWECGERKQMIDCVHYSDLSPANMFAPADDFCGRTILAQEKYKSKYCLHGVRKNMACEQDNDCPSTNNDKKYNRVPNCKERYAVAGCQAATQQQCSDVDYKFLSAMMV